MAYCAQADVEALNAKKTYGESTSPTASQVGEMIDYVAGEIDSILSGRGYVVPVTTPDVLVTRLKMLNAQGAAGLANAAMHPTKEENIYWDMYKNGLKSLRTDPLPATTEETASGLDGPASHYTEYSGSDDFPEPKFKMSDEY